MAENVEPRCSTHEDDSIEPAEGAISMIDVLEEEKQLEDDANAVLGDSDDKNCTYLMVSSIGSGGSHFICRFF